MKWVKKPVVVDAVRWMTDNYFEIEDFVGDKLIPVEGGSLLVIKTLEGDMTARPFDWIIKGVSGEFYPCKPDIFEKSYSPVESPITTPLTEFIEKWECFCDDGYYHLWAVRPVGDGDFNSQKLFHVQTEQEAKALTNILNSHQAIIEEKEREIERLNEIIALKESERKNWAEMCIKKQETIEEQQNHIEGLNDVLAVADTQIQSLTEEIKRLKNEPH